MIDPQVLAFAGAVALLTITPGADTMMVIKNVLAYGRGAGFLTVFGVCSGLLIHAALSGLGLSVILLQSAQAFMLVKTLGAVYLIYLGVRSVWGFWRSDTDAHDLNTTHMETRTLTQAYREGVITNVLNPKVAVFYLAFLPQFLNPGDPVLVKSVLLACIHFVFGVIWLSGVTLAINTVREALTRPRTRQALEAVSGLVLIGLGLHLALEPR
jgi:threonine/homoserine/homoserine lactone efflux protein